MWNRTLALAAALALSANLLVPMQVMKYHACCLDEQGYPVLHQASCFTAKSDARITSLKDCCSPKVVKLRQAPPQTGTQAANGNMESDGLAVLPQPPRFTALWTYSSQLLATYPDTGPPGSGSLLPTLSRLNV